MGRGGIILCRRGGREIWIGEIWICDGESADGKGSLDGDIGSGVGVYGGLGRGDASEGFPGCLIKRPVGSERAAHLAQSANESAEDTEVFCGRRSATLAEFPGHMDRGKFVDSGGGLGERRAEGGGMGTVVGSGHAGSAGTTRLSEEGVSAQTTKDNHTYVVETNIVG